MSIVSSYCLIILAISWYIRQFYTLLYSRDPLSNILGIFDFNKFTLFDIAQKLAIRASDLFCQRLLSLKIIHLTPSIYCCDQSGKVLFSALSTKIAS